MKLGKRKQPKTVYIFLCVYLFNCCQFPKGLAKPTELDNITPLLVLVSSGNLLIISVKHYITYLHSTDIQLCCNTYCKCKFLLETRWGSNCVLYANALPLCSLTQGPQTLFCFQSIFCSAFHVSGFLTT